MLLNSYHFQQHYGFSIMVLAKPWYHTAIICATIKYCKKVEIVLITTTIQHYLNFYQ